MSASDEFTAIYPDIVMFPVRTPTIPPATHTNCYVLGTTELVIVDPASPYLEEQERLERYLERRIGNGAQVVAIFLTHHHGDHVGGVEILRRRFNVPVLAHLETQQRLDPFVPVDYVIEDCQEFLIGGHRWTAYYTPGHADGHLIFHQPEQRLIIAGDMVAGIGTIVIFPPEGRLRRYLDSLRLMQRLSPLQLLPSHGPSILDAVGKLQEYIDHRLMREAQVVQHLKLLDSATPDQLAQRIYEGLSASVMVMARGTVLAHLQALEEDGRVVARGESFQVLS